MHLTMKNRCRHGAIAASMLLVSGLSAQITIGGKVGVNYLIGSQEIQPAPKNAPTTPKGLGLSFGAFAGIPFSDLVGIRPELCFSFRKGKSQSTQNTTYAQADNVTLGGLPFVGQDDIQMDSDQRLSYFQVNVPLTLSPSEGFRVMLGPSFNFLMGGKQNTDVTENIKGTVTNQGQQQSVDQQNFQTTKKTGSAAIKDFKKADIMVLAGVGYTLPVGFDMDLRYYRGLSTTYDHSEGSSRSRIWTNLVELSVGWQFGGK